MITIVLLVLLTETKLVVRDVKSGAIEFFGKEKG